MALVFAFMEVLPSGQKAACLEWFKGSKGESNRHHREIDAGLRDVIGVVGQRVMRHVGDYLHDMAVIQASSAGAQAAFTPRAIDEIVAAIRTQNPDLSSNLTPLGMPRILWPA